MAARLPLPKMGELPKAVIFHREHPDDPRIVLQVPNEFGTDSETYVLRMDRPSDAQWMRYLKNSKALTYELTLEQHVVFYTNTGHYEAVEDVHALSPVGQVFEEAKMVKETFTHRERIGQERRSNMVNKLVDWPMTRLRRMIGGRTIRW